MDVLVERRTGRCDRHARLGSPEKPKVFNQPGNDPGIVADAHRRIERYLPVLDKQLEGRNYVVGPLTVVDFLIGPRLDTAPGEYRRVQERLKAKPYWSTA